MRYSLLYLNNKELKLRLNIENCVLLEKQLNKNPYDVLINITQFNAKIKDIKLFLKYSLKEYHSDLSVNDIYEELIDNGYNQIDISYILIDVFKEAGFFDKYDEESIDEDEENRAYSEEDSKDPINSLNMLFLNLLESALYYGIEEKDYWNMTYGEAVRSIKAKAKKEKDEYKQKLTSDYALANLIGVSVGRLLSKDAKMPDLYDCYPELFKEEAEEERRRAEESFEDDFFNILDTWDRLANSQEK